GGGGRTGGRPPSSKSTPGNTMGGGGEYASRSTVNVAMVPFTSAMGSGVISSVRSPSNDTRDGGMKTMPSVVSRLPTKPYFQSDERAAAVPDMRAGSGRRGGSMLI